MSVFTAAAENKIPKVINCSSMARYGTQEVVPFVEDMVPKPQDPYGIAKLASEQTLEVLSDVHNFQYVNLVYTTLLDQSKNMTTHIEMLFQ